MPTLDDLLHHIPQGSTRSAGRDQNDGASTGTLVRGHAQGNAAVESREHRGWFLGHFMTAGAEHLTSSESVEVKWGEHRAGEHQEEWSFNRVATTMSLLVHGRDQIAFPDGTVLLENPGDYAIWAPGTPHKWRVIEDSLILTIRWPSLADDVVLLHDSDLEDYLTGQTT